MVCELFELERRRAACALRRHRRRARGRLAGGSQAAPVTLSCPPSTIAVGIGAFGAGDADCLHRFGEFLAVSGAAAYLPADGTEVPDYLVASGAEAPSVRVSRGLVVRRRLRAASALRAHRPRRRRRRSPTLAAVCLELSRGDAAAVVVIAETVGAGRRGAAHVAV